MFLVFTEGSRCHSGHSSTRRKQIAEELTLFLLDRFFHCFPKYLEVINAYSWEIDKVFWTLGLMETFKWRKLLRGKTFIFLCIQFPNGDKQLKSNINLKVLRLFIFIRNQSENKETKPIKMILFNHRSTSHQKSLVISLGLNSNLSNSCTNSMDVSGSRARGTLGQIWLSWMNQPKEALDQFFKT